MTSLVLTHKDIIIDILKYHYIYESTLLHFAFYEQSLVSYKL